jgi:hypothetical protein
MYLTAPTRGRGRLGRVAPRRSLGAAQSNFVSDWVPYSEQVVRAYGSGRYSILLRRESNGLQGLGAPAGPTTLSVAAPVAGAAASAVAAGASLGAAAGPIGAAVGALVGLIAGIWAGHDARAAGAKTENAALNSAVVAFDASIKAVFQAANAGQITGQQAVQLCQQIQQSYWQGMSSFMSGPGRSDCSNGGTNCSCSDPYCKNKKCTAGCCAGCFDIMPSIANCITAFSSPTGGSAQILEIYGSSYGTQQRNAYTLAYTPPAAGSVAGVANSLTSGSITGIPLIAILGAAALGIYALT